MRSSIRCARAAVGAFDRIGIKRLPGIGETARITAGAFEGMIGRLVELGDQDRSRDPAGMLELLGRQVRAQVDLATVEAA